MSCWIFCCVCVVCLFFVQAEGGIRDLVRSRGLGDVYKRQGPPHVPPEADRTVLRALHPPLLRLHSPQQRHKGLSAQLRIDQTAHPPVNRLRDRRAQPSPDPVSYTHLTLPTSDLV
mgnify:CR=1 FL=1